MQVLIKLNGLYKDLTTIKIMVITFQELLKKHYQSLDSHKQGPKSIS